MPRCKNCKEKFEPITFNQKYCLEDDCVKVFVEVTKAKAWKKRKKEMKEELKTVQELLKETQIVFNRWIRQRDKGLPCISCRNEKPKKINAGHYFSSGGHKNVTFDERNVHLQCEYCNTYLSGNLIEYREGLIERIGEDNYKQLCEIAYRERKFTREELIELKEYYKLKLKQ
jgi:hypothetical protein